MNDQSEVFKDKMAKLATLLRELEQTYSAGQFQFCFFGVLKNSPHEEFEPTESLSAYQSNVREMPIALLIEAFAQRQIDKAKQFDLFKPFSNIENLLVKCISSPVRPEGVDPAGWIKPGVVYNVVMYKTTHTGLLIKVKEKTDSDFPQPIVEPSQEHEGWDTRNFVIENYSLLN
jgi:hypothetical protein